MLTNTALQERRDIALPRGLTSTCEVYAERALNAEVWDVEGNRYIDFAGGVGSLNTGHRHPRVLGAALEQQSRLVHTAFETMPYESYVALAERLNALAPGDSAKKTVLMTSGSEAVEVAVRIARVATGRPGVVAFSGAFHGRTVLSMALTGKATPYKIGMGPFPTDVYRVPYPRTYHGISSSASLAALNTLFKTDAPPSRVAAILIEPVQGDGGFYVAPFDFLREVRKVCDNFGIHLICDEIQCGFGRTGRFFAIEHSGVVPDIITMAKSLAGGYTLSAITGRADIMDSVPPGGLGSTHGGNPVACAAALGVLQVIEEEGLLERSRELGARIVDRLRSMAARTELSCIGDVRGLGGMVGIELVKDRRSREPAPDLIVALRREALSRGLLLRSGGFDGNVIRVLVPLTVSNVVVDEGLNIFEKSLEAIVAQMEQAA